MNQRRRCFLALRYGYSWIWPISLRLCIVPATDGDCRLPRVIIIFWHACRRQAGEPISCACGAALARLAGCSNKIKKTKNQRSGSLRCVYLTFRVGGSSNKNVMGQWHTGGSVFDHLTRDLTCRPLTYWGLTHQNPTLSFYVFTLMSLIDRWWGWNIYKRFTSPKSSCVRSWRQKQWRQDHSNDGNHCSNHQSSHSRIQATDKDLNLKLKPCHC